MHFVVGTKVELLLRQQHRHECRFAFDTRFARRLSRGFVGILKARVALADTRHCFSSSSAEAILLRQLHTHACNRSMPPRYTRGKTPQTAMPFDSPRHRAETRDRPKVQLAPAAANGTLFAQ